MLGMFASAGGGDLLRRLCGGLRERESERRQERQRLSRSQCLPRSRRSGRQFLVSLASLAAAIFRRGSRSGSPWPTGLGRGGEARLWLSPE